jgi:hypothetical protein
VSYGRSHISTIRDELSAMRGSSDPSLCHFTGLCHAALTARAAASGFQKSATHCQATPTALAIQEGARRQICLKLRGSGCRLPARNDRISVPRERRTAGGFNAACRVLETRPSSQSRSRQGQRSWTLWRYLKDLHRCLSEGRSGKATTQRNSLLLRRLKYRVEPERALSIHQAPANLS